MLKGMSRWSKKEFEVRGDGKIDRARSSRRQKWMSSRAGID